MREIGEEVLLQSWREIVASWVRVVIVKGSQILDTCVESEADRILLDVVRPKSRVIDDFTHCGCEQRKDNVAIHGDGHGCW